MLFFKKKKKYSNYFLKDNLREEIKKNFQLLVNGPMEVQKFIDGIGKTKFM